MRHLYVRGVLIAIAVAATLPLQAGDSMWGRVTAVKRADLLRLEDQHGGYDVRLAGIAVPREGQIAEKAMDFVRKLVLEKNARARLERFTADRVMVARVITDDPQIGFKDVGLELVRAGLARRLDNFDYKYGELAIAERAARAEKRGLWGAQ